jgi:polysaccharide biosynthesis/export protein
MRSLAALMVLMAGCTAARLPDAPITPEDDPNFSAPEMELLPGVESDEPEALRILPGDVVTLQTMSAETVEHEGLIVDERGLLHVPLVGDVEVGGLSLVEAERRIEEALHQYDAIVRANLVLSDPTGHQATVLGAVREPGRVPLLPGTRVADLLAAVGGPLIPASEQANAPIADLGGARVVRNGQALPVSIPLAMQGDPRHNIYARAGDHLYVPPHRGQSVTVLGEVNSPTMLGFYQGIRLTHALALAGGLGPDAHRRDVRVVRGPLRDPQVYHVSFRALVDGEGTDVELAAGDIVYVTRTGVANIRDVLGAIGPALATGQSVAIAFGLSTQ